jgi:peptidyl-dipeptidase Dcp
MAWHTNTEEVENVEQYEEKILQKTALLAKVKNTSVSTHFGHIFGGGYAAGYYSYKWAEVLEADAFESFQQDGIFNENTAKSFRDNILSKGNLKDPMELYKNFKGREPKVEALLKRDGLI